MSLSNVFGSCARNQTLTPPNDHLVGANNGLQSPCPRPRPMLKARDENRAQKAFGLGGGDLRDLVFCGIPPLLQAQFQGVLVLI